MFSWPISLKVSHEEFILMVCGPDEDYLEKITASLETNSALVNANLASKYSIFIESPLTIKFVYILGWS